MADGIVHKECLDMAGGVTMDYKGAVQSVSDTLWRTLCANRDENGKRAPSFYRIALLHLFQKIPNLRDIDTTELLEEFHPGHITEFLWRVQEVSWNRRVFVAKPIAGDSEGLVGLAPRYAQLGDYVCILFGGSVPFILRRHEKDGRCLWELIGESYVDGKMDGEALIGATEEALEARSIMFEIR